MGNGSSDSKGFCFLGVVQKNFTGAGTWFAFLFLRMKTRPTTPTAFIAAMFLACTPEPTEDTDDLKSGLTQPGMYDPDHVEERLTELALEYGPRVDPEEVELLLEGEITSQEALDLNAEEHDALEREMRLLFLAGKRFYKEDPGRILEQRNNGKKPPRKGGSDKEVTCDDSAYRRCLYAAATGTALSPPNFWPALGLVTAYICLCEYCQGGWVDKACLR